MDRISTLPDEILSSILSRLNLMEAVRTSVLCRRWERLWTLVPSLNFFSLLAILMGAIPSGFNPNHFISIINHWLLAIEAILHSIHPPIKSCIIPIFLPQGVGAYVVFAPRFDRILITMKEKFIENLTIYGIQGAPYILPREIISCPSLRKLELHGFSLILPGLFPPLSDRLVTLTLQRLTITQEQLERMISNCVNLQYLKVYFCPGITHIRISTPSLILLEIGTCWVTNISFLQRVYFTGQVSLKLYRAQEGDEDNVLIKLETSYSRSQPEEFKLCLGPAYIHREETQLLSAMHFGRQVNSLMLLELSICLSDVCTAPTLLSLLGACPNLAQLSIIELHCLGGARKNPDFWKNQETVECLERNIQSIHLDLINVNRVDTFEFLRFLMRTARALKFLTIDYWKGPKKVSKFIERLSGELERANRELIILVKRYPIIEL